MMSKKEIKRLIKITLVELQKQKGQNENQEHYFTGKLQAFYNILQADIYKNTLDTDTLNRLEEFIIL